MKGQWIGVDLDGTLAQYTTWNGPEHIGDPIPAMVERVQEWLLAGLEVRIVTARVCHLYLPNATDEKRAEAEKCVKAIRQWTFQHIGVALEVTAVKDFAMRELWDDRAVSVEINTGRDLRVLDRAAPP